MRKKERNGKEFEEVAVSSAASSNASRLVLLEQWG